MVMLTVMVPREGGIEYPLPPVSQPEGTPLTATEPGPNGTLLIVYWPLRLETVLWPEPSWGRSVRVTPPTAPVFELTVPVMVPEVAAVRLSFGL